MTQTCGTPVRVETKARERPSGEKVGDQQAPTCAIAVTMASRLSGVWPEMAGTIANSRTAATHQNLNFDITVLLLSRIKAQSRLMARSGSICAALQAGMNVAKKAVRSR